MEHNLISQILADFNTIEGRLKTVIRIYVDPKEDDFFEDYIMNNLIVNFASKYKLLRAILKRTDKPISKDFDKSIKIIMTIRNSVAHSEFLNNETIVDAEIDSDGFQFPIYGHKSKIITLENDEMIENDIIDKYKVFQKYFETACNELDKIETQLGC
jgi:hypothetical protein